MSVETQFNNCRIRRRPGKIFKNLVELVKKELQSCDHIYISKYHGRVAVIRDQVGGLPGKNKRK
jgi:hypothetical protein